MAKLEARYLLFVCSYFVRHRYLLRYLVATAPWGTVPILEMDGNISIISGEKQLTQTHYKRRKNRKNLMRMP